jgi:branched-chain amino acid aminotransferase
MHRLILRNDEILDSREPCLTPGQVGLLAGWGVFSTIRVSRGVLFAWERHFARMTRDAEALHVPFPSDPQWMEERLQRLVEANRAFDATLRVVVVRNTGSVWSGPASRDFDLLALTTDLHRWGESVRLGVVPHGRHAANRFAGTKVLSWAFNLTWYEEARDRGYDEVVLLNERDEVAECTSANIFAVRGREVWTPPLSSGCLAGVTRDLLLNEVASNGYSVEERVLQLADLESADGVFITSTTRDLLPVDQIEGLHVGGHRDACVALRTALRAYIENYVSARVAV